MDAHRGKMIWKPRFLVVAITFAAIVVVVMSVFAPVDRWLIEASAQFKPAPTVYDAIVDALYLDAETSYRIWGGPIPPTSLLLLREKSGDIALTEPPDEQVPRLRTEFPTSDPEAIRTFVNTNRTLSMHTEAVLSFSNVELIPQLVEDSLFPELDIEGREFRRRYPDAHGVLTLSNVGYSRDSTTAIAYASNYNGFAWDGFWFHLRHTSDGWRIVTFHHEHTDIGG